MNFEVILKEINRNNENHLSGYYNCIPFMGMERLESYLPGIEQGTYYAIVAGTGVGKSKLARYLFVHNPLMYLEQNPESGVEISIKYFSLEESKKKIILSEISKYLYTKYNLVISVKQLQSIGRYNTLTADHLLKIKEAEEHVNSFISKVDIIDNIKNPTGIFKYVRDFALTIGKYYTKEGVALTPQQHEEVRQGKDETYKLVSYYKKNNPKHYVIILIDHISLIHLESGMTQHQSMSKLSSDYCLTFRDKFGFTPVVVQQLAMDKENVETNFQGKTIEQKLEPSLNALGDNKTIGRDYNVVLGLFSPERYGIINHNGYDLGKLKNRYRSLSILKDREGIADKKVPLFFNGAVDFFKELPVLTDTAGLNRVHAYVQELNRI
jgi:hypothetical protein